MMAKAASGGIWWIFNKLFCDSSLISGLEAYGEAYGEKVCLMKSESLAESLNRDAADFRRSFFISTSLSCLVVVIIIRLNLLINSFLMNGDWGMRGKWLRVVNWFSVKTSPRKSFPHTLSSGWKNCFPFRRWHKSNHCPWKRESISKSFLLNARKLFLQFPFLIIAFPSANGSLIKSFRTLDFCIVKLRIRINRGAELSFIIRQRQSEQ